MSWSFVAARSLDPKIAIAKNDSVKGLHDKMGRSISTDGETRALYIQKQFLSAL